MKKNQKTTTNFPKTNEEYDKSPWLWKGSLFDDSLAESYFGFVYLITNKSSGKKYIGRKYFTSKRKKGKGKRRITSESDWRYYWSSSDTLKTDVNTLGSENFTREIIALCKGKGACNFYEVKMLFEHKVLETDNWYNDTVSGKYFSERVKKYLKSDILV